MTIYGKRNVEFISANTAYFNNGQTDNNCDSVIYRFRLFVSRIMSGLPSFSNLQNLTFLDTPDDFGPDTPQDYDYPDFPHTPSHDSQPDHDFIGSRRSENFRVS